MLSKVPVSQLRVFEQQIAGIRFKPQLRNDI
jgi:hypothetical protein